MIVELKWQSVYNEANCNIKIVITKVMTSDIIVYNEANCNIKEDDIEEYLELSQVYNEANCNIKDDCGG